MRVLLQNTETKLYFINPNEWTDDPLKATDFEQVDHAADVYHSRGLSYAQIIVDEDRIQPRPNVLAELVKQVRAQG